MRVATSWVTLVLTLVCSLVEPGHGADNGGEIAPFQWLATTGALPSPSLITTGALPNQSPGPTLGLPRRGVSVVIDESQWDGIPSEKQPGRLVYPTSAFLVFDGTGNDGALRVQLSRMKSFTLTEYRTKEGLRSRPRFPTAANTVRDTVRLSVHAPLTNADIFDPGLPSAWDRPRSLLEDMWIANARQSDGLGVLIFGTVSPFEAAHFSTSFEFIMAMAAMLFQGDPSLNLNAERIALWAKMVGGQEWEEIKRRERTARGEKERTIEALSYITMRPVLSEQASSSRQPETYGTWLDFFMDRSTSDYKLRGPFKP